MRYGEYKTREEQHKEILPRFKRKKELYRDEGICFVCSQHLFDAQFGVYSLSITGCKPGDPENPAPQSWAMPATGLCMEPLIW